LKRATTISGSSSNAVKKIKDPSKAAKNVIRDNTGVGTDLRPPPPIPIPTKPSSLGASFLKPSGVDAPSAGEIRSHGHDAGDPDDIVHGAREKTKKRERLESGNGSTEAEGKKRKKKRKSAD
jgi:hypothetical protein